VRSTTAPLVNSMLKAGDVKPGDSLCISDGVVVVVDAVRSHPSATSAVFFETAAALFPPRQKGATTVSPAVAVAWIAERCRCRPRTKVVVWVLGRVVGVNTEQGIGADGDGVDDGT
jgi:hypothetical protein